MKRIADKIIDESVLLSACEKGDTVKLNYKPDKCHQSIGNIEVVKVKKLPKGMLQLKYKPPRHFVSKPSVVQKIILPSDMTVVRSRKATANDHENAGVPTRDTVMVNGIEYESHDPEVFAEDAIKEARLVSDDQVEILPPLEKSKSQRENYDTRYSGFDGLFGGFVSTRSLSDINGILVTSGLPKLHS